MAKKTQELTEKSSAPLRRSLVAAWHLYRKRIRSILVATFFPLGLIVLLRWLSDDYTGDQYSVVIGLVSIFNTMLLVRLVTVGWSRKQVKLVAYYNGVMSRYLSGIGLMAVVAVHSLPLLAGILLLGLVAVSQLSAGWLVLILPLVLFGLAAIMYVSFALFAMMDDLSVSVMQSIRISGRLVRRYARPLVGRALAGAAIMLGVGLLLAWIGTGLAPSLQSPQSQLLVDALLSWLLTPLVFCYGAVVYQRLIEAYE